VPATPPFDPERGWALAATVALRPEPFGALAYDFDTRRLSFLKTKALVGVVERLAEESTARAAIEAAGVSTADLPTYERALARLADTGMIVPREGP
jgi:putative mycofactocin binding protein MftB